MPLKLFYKIRNWGKKQKPKSENEIQQKAKSKLESIQEESEESA